ncbi:Ig-like domain-containing protein [Pedobacter foliorum]|uniref:Ig-like domain-containing protein n=1 Tax=Pedobacter foliorum TaxID=2739058 RepID=UPI001563B608|nr:Ig-like domain-containing protein [Pedobacter foliorum]NRF38524.1 hypothetical protein [Pedobacter foliorum]
MKHKILTGILVKIIVLLLALNANSQTLESLENAFTKYHQTHLQEKLFVHSDKESYLATEIIWFKIYNVDGILNSPLNLSKIAYVEILDAANNAIQQVKISLNEGSGSGSIYLPTTVSSGNYKLRAYTNWMKNFDAQYYFEKQIRIINTQSALITDQQNSDEDIDIQFFPEGGTMITGINGKVACKVIGKDGKGLAYIASIVNHNDTITRFSSLKFGIGTFQLKPSADLEYKCILTVNGKKIVKSLPKVELQGYAMQIADTTSGKIRIDISTTVNTSEMIYLIAHSSHVIKDAQGIKTNQGKASFIIDKEKLASGISNFTIFNSSGVPICGRLFFKPVEQVLNINASTDKQEYPLRKMVTVQVSAIDQQKTHQIANLSLSVFKTDALQTDNKEHILSYLWLKSELKGYIESPDYYFKNMPETIAAADNLMLTNGWRKYTWDNVLNNKQQILKFLPENEGHLITGKATDKFGNALNNVGLFFSVPGNQAKISSTNTKPDGSFTFNVKEYFGDNEVVLQINSLKDTTSTITLYSPFSEQHSNVKYPSLDLSQFKTADLTAWNRNNVIQNSYFGLKLREMFQYPSDTSAFYVNPFKRYMMNDYVRFPTMKEVFREFVSEVYMVKETGETGLRVITPNGLLNSNPLIILNGTPIFNTAKLMKIDPHKIRSIEIINHRYFLGNRLEDGILNFSTYKNDMAGYEIEPNALVLDYEGLQQKTVFYAPVYENKAQIESKLPDFRTVMSWIPEFKTNEQGHKKLSFYTSDLPGTYIGIIQGITSSGNAGYTSFKFEVQN